VPNVHLNIATLNYIHK